MLRAPQFLLRSRLLRGKQKRPPQATSREARPKRSYSKRLEIEVAVSSAKLLAGLELHSSYLSRKLRPTPEGSPKGIWTHYGRWNEAGTKVYERGYVIYELPGHSDVREGEAPFGSPTELRWPSLASPRADRKP